MAFRRILTFLLICSIALPPHLCGSTAHRAAPIHPAFSSLFAREALMLRLESVVRGREKNPAAVRVSRMASGRLSTRLRIPWAKAVPNDTAGAMPWWAQERAALLRIVAEGNEPRSEIESEAPHGWIILRKVAANSISKSVDPILKIPPALLPLLLASAAISWLIGFSAGEPETTLWAATALGVTTRSLKEMAELIDQRQAFGRRVGAFLKRFGRSRAPSKPFFRGEQGSEIDGLLQESLLDLVSSRVPSVPGVTNPGRHNLVRTVFLTLNSRGKVIDRERFIRELTTVLLTEQLSHLLLTGILHGGLSRPDFDRLFHALHPPGRRGNILTHPSEVGRLLTGRYAADDRELIRIHEGLTEFFQEPTGENQYLLGFARDLGRHLRGLLLSYPLVAQTNRLRNGVDYVLGFVVIERLMSRLPRALEYLASSRSVDWLSEKAQLGSAFIDLIAGDPASFLDWSDFSAINRRAALGSLGERFASLRTQIESGLRLYVDDIEAQRQLSYFQKLRALKPVLRRVVDRWYSDLLHRKALYIPLDTSDKFLPVSFASAVAARVFRERAVPLWLLDRPIFDPDLANVVRRSLVYDELSMGMEESRNGLGLLSIAAIGRLLGGSKATRGRAGLVLLLLGFFSVTALARAPGFPFHSAAQGFALASMPIFAIPHTISGQRINPSALRRFAAAA